VIFFPSPPGAAQPRLAGEGKKESAQIPLFSPAKISIVAR